MTPRTVGWPGGSEQPGHSWKHAGTQETAVVGHLPQRSFRSNDR